jgi:hypothetical protein
LSERFRRTKEANVFRPDATTSIKAPVLAVAAIGMGLAVTFLDACAPAPPRDTHVLIAQEAAIIVWDAASKTQHFIRRASFETRAEKESLASPDFGFLVPTPTVPELAEASDAAFDVLRTVMQPAVVYENRYSVGSLFFAVLMPGAKSARMDKTGAGSDVRVLHTQRVAGYDAVVLEADNAKSLSDWLQAHGYAARATLTDWLVPYVAAKWKLTAFKIAPADEKGTGNDQEKHADRAISTSAVRMSFKTERPFFPYREPTDQVELSRMFQRERLLQVFFIGTSRMSGVLGEKTSSPWPATTKWAGPLPDQQGSNLAGALKLTPAQMPANPWLTTFEDRSPQRAGGEDLFFASSAEQTPISPPPIRRFHDVMIPIEGIVLGLVLVGVVIWTIVQRRKRAA